MTNDCRTEGTHKQVTSPSAADEPSKNNHPNSVQVLKGLEHIRRRPGMYIGDTSIRGLHQLVYELLANSVSEAQAGLCNLIQVEIHGDGSLSVSDDGRGIPVDLHPTLRTPLLELIMTTQAVGLEKYRTMMLSLGLNIVNALSERTRAQIRRDGKKYIQEYARGIATTEVRAIGNTTRTGTSITFKPDSEIFEDTTFDYETLEWRLRELAFLNRGLTFRLSDERCNREAGFRADGGIVDFVLYLNRNKKPLHPVIYFDGTVEAVRVEAAFQYANGHEDQVYSFTNNHHTSGGGTHSDGFWTGLAQALNVCAKEARDSDDLWSIETRDLQRGVACVVSVQVPYPHFHPCQSLRLLNPEIEKLVADIVLERTSSFLREYPAAAQSIKSHVAKAARMRKRNSR